MRSELINPLTDERWAAFVDRAAAASAFHTVPWLELLRRTYGYPLTACCLVDESGTIRAGSPLARTRPRRLVSLPFSDHCAPLGDSAALAAALDDLRRRRRARLEIRAELPGAAPAASFHLHEIPLDGGYEEVVKRFKRRSQLLRGARRAEREGLVVERRSDAAALAEFYALHVETRRHQGVPTQPRRFILGFEELFARGLGHVLLVRDGDRAIAAAVFLAFNGTVIYKYGASDRAALGKRPNNLLFLEAIRRACEDGMRTLDLGRTDSGHETLRDFKLSWGAEERVLAYHELSERAPRAGGTGLAERAAPLIRRSPPVVGRLVGEALYKYAG